MMNIGDSVQLSSRYSPSTIDNYGIGTIVDKNDSGFYRVAFNYFSGSIVHVWLDENGIVLKKSPVPKFIKDEKYQGLFE